MVVSKSSEMNNNAPAAKEKYAASTMTFARAWLFVMTISMGPLVGIAIAN
jgi:hypothetical protein